MKIAVIGPSPVPFTIGGIENLMWGLCETINQTTEHQCELIKLPSRELNFWDLIETYYSFYKLDVSQFDVVIYCKYPAWMVRHPRGICYMAHCLRGLYDTYQHTPRPTEVPRENPDVNRILDYMDTYYRPESLDTFFDMLFELKDKRTVPQSYYAFPGPLIRKIIWYLDRWGLSQTKTERYYSISETVKNRTDYFPPDTEVGVVYPPSTLQNYSAGDYRYIFMVSRLDGPKRIDMLIRAMQYVKSEIPLYIAGTGPERERLEKLAAGDARIHFLGYVKDEEVEEYYRNSLVVPYFPYDEDYGYITIEAMLHRKPVITTVDAGGPKEFVRNGETGYVTAFEEHAIAEKIDYFAQHPEEAGRMGENAYQTVQAITWQSVVDGILRDLPKEKPERTKNRKKLTVTSTFQIAPPQGGGQARIYNLYKNVAKEYDVEIVSFTNHRLPGFDGEITRGVREIRIPESREHAQQEAALSKEAGLTVTDIAMIRYSGLTAEYGEALKKSIESSDCIVISHPYLYPEAKKYMGEHPFIYEAHNVEYLLKQSMLKDSSVKEQLLQEVFDTEKECCEKSRFIMACSEEDKQKLCELYQVAEEKVIVVPNGVDTQQMHCVSPEERLQNKVQLDQADTPILNGQKIGLFMGSWHKPNLDACEEIFQIAKACPETVFLLMGSQCRYFVIHNDEYEIPKNVGLLGLVSEEEKKQIFGLVDFALNPMVAGSGTNLKIFDYMSAGIPVITTPLGARGIPDPEGLLIHELSDFPAVIRSFDLKEQDANIKAARGVAEKEFDWSVIAEKLNRRMEEL